MATAQEYSQEELNYLKVCHVTTRIITDGLRVLFKQLWDTRYQATHGQWQDTAKNGIDLYSMESIGSRKKTRELAISRKGNRLKCDCTSLFSAILYSDSIGKGLDPVVRKAVDNLRQFRNKAFAHVSDGKLCESDFQTSIQTVIDAFSALKQDTADIEAIKNQKTFPTEELRVTQQQLEKEKMRNEEPQSFCVLPPKPSHEVTDRSGEVNEILEEMNKLRSTKKDEVTVVYLSGNPGCGKSEIGRQIGAKVFDDVSDSVTDQVNFVFPLNASITDTLIQSYVEFAISLNCDENSTTSIGTSKDLSQEDKLFHLKSLVAPKLRKYSSWLLIVDNVTDVKSVLKHLPRAGEKTKGNGQILVTTQDSRSISASDSHSYHISLSRGMKPDEAVRTLSKISGIASNKECVLQVAKALDFQPLALACAAYYMKRVSYTKPSMSWEEYLQKLQQGKREATEGEYERISVSYSKPMTAAVKLALENEMAKDMIMKHTFQFLTVLAPERIPLEYVIQYVTRCLPNQDEDLVASTVVTSSLILSSENQSKEIGVHQVVHSCLQYAVPQMNKEEEFSFLMNVIQAFSALLNGFDINNVNDIIATKFAAVHFMHLSKRLVPYTTKPSSSITLRKDFRNECEGITYSMQVAGRLCKTHAKYKAANTLYKMVLIMYEAFYHPNHPKIAEALDDAGRSLRHLWEHEEARKCHEIALAIYEMSHDENHPNVAGSLNNLGNSLRDLGKHEEARECYERALAIRETAYDENHPLVADSLNNLGNSLRDLGKHEEARKCYERALAIKETAYDENHPKVADSLNNLGNSLRDLGKHEEARECYERALAIYEMSHDENHPKVADSLNNLGNSLRDLGKHEEARKCYERALAIREMAYDENHPKVADSLNNLGNSLSDLGKHEEARKCYERALAIRETAYDENHPKVADSLNNLGNSLSDLGKHEEARKCYERALAIRETAYDENHPLVADSLYNLGNSLRDLGKHEEARKCYERALAIRETAYDENHPLVADSLNNLGNSLSDLGKHEEARKCDERALAIRETAYDENHPLVADSLNNLGNSLRDLGKHEEARKCYERALAIREMAYDENHPLVADSLNNLGNSLRDLGKHEEARKCDERTLAIRETAYDENHPKIADSLNNLGNSLRDLGKHEEARKCYERALAIYEMTYDENHPKIADSLNNLGISLSDLGKYEEARKCHERALAIRELAFNKNHRAVENSAEQCPTKETNKRDNWLMKKWRMVKVSLRYGSKNGSMSK